MLRFGLLATLTFFLANFLLSLTRCHARHRQVVLSDVDDDAADRVGAGVLGFYASRGGEPLLGRRLLD